MFSVYVLMNPGGRLYIGHTENLAARLKRHSAGDSRWTSNRGPWRLVVHEEFATRSDAMRRERALKSGRLNQELRAKLAEGEGVERVLPRKD
jgi:putative endonuclease